MFSCVFCVQTCFGATMFPVFTTLEKSWRKVLNSQEKENTWHEEIHRVLGYLRKDFPHIFCPGYAGPMKAQVFCPLEVCVWDEERMDASLALSKRSFSFGWRTPQTSPIWGMKKNYIIKAASSIERALAPGGFRKTANLGQYAFKVVNIGGICQSHLYVPNFLLLWIELNIGM